MSGGIAVAKQLLAEDDLDPRVRPLLDAVERQSHFIAESLRDVMRGPEQVRIALDELDADREIRLDS